MILAEPTLQLEGYYVRDLHCSVQEGLDESTKMTLASGLHVQPSSVMAGSPFAPACYLEADQHQKDPNRFRVVLKITSENDKDGLLPYRFNVTLIGYFRAVGLKLTTSVHPYLIRNAATILYSSTRELLASVTGRGPLPALVLPTVTFLDQEEPPKPSVRKPVPRKKLPGKAVRRTSKKK